MPDIYIYFFRLIQSSPAYTRVNTLATKCRNLTEMPSRLAMFLLLGLSAYLAHGMLTNEFDSILKQAAHGILKANSSIARPEPIPEMTAFDKDLDYPHKICIL